MVDSEPAPSHHNVDSDLQKPPHMVPLPMEAAAQLDRGHNVMRGGIEIERFKVDDAYAADVNMALAFDLIERKQRGGSNTVYTELHRAGERFVLLPEIAEWKRHAATVGGNHSMLDALDLLDTSLGSRFQLHALAIGLGLNTKTVCAKGYSSIEGTRITFVSQELRRQKDTYDWMDTLPDMLEKRPLLDLRTRENGSEQPAVEFEAVKQRFSATIYDKLIPVHSATPTSIVSGFVVGPGAGTELNPHIERRGSYLTKSYSLYLDAYSGKSNMHEPVYMAAGMKRPHYFELTADGYAQQVACDYTLDEERNYVNVMLLFRDGQPTDRRFDTVRAAMHKAIKERFAFSASEINLHETLENNGKKIFGSQILQGEV